MSVFDEVTTWVPTGDGRYTGSVPDDWMQGRAAFGGLLGAGAIRLAEQVEPDRPVRSLEARFFEPVAAGAFDVRVETLRAGRSLAHVQVEVWQADHRCYRAVVCLASARESDLVVPSAEAPPGREPEALPAMPYVAGLTPAFTQHVDFRFNQGMPFSGAKEATIDGWCRFSAGSTGLAGVIGLLDTWPAPVLAMGTAPFPASTVHWTAHLLAAPETDPTAWYRYRAETRHSGGGTTTFVGRLWRRDGSLVCWSEQLAAVFDRR